MLRFLCKSIPSSNKNSKQLFKLYSTLSTKPTNPTSLQNAPQDSFTVQYLMNRCGFSMEKAVLATSKHVNFDTPDQPESVITFFKKQGFTETQIKKLVTIEPRILSGNPRYTLLPTIQFFKSNGFSGEDLARILVFFPTTFSRSLEECIVPSFSFIKDFLGSEVDAVFAISNFPRVLLQLESHVKPNIEIMLGAGMSKSGIASLMKTQPSVFISGGDKLKESVNQLRNMNMDPESSSYGSALFVLTVLRRSTWDKRIEAFKKWGCSEEDVVESFKISPNVMMVSEEKVNAVMSFFVNEVGWEPSEVVKRDFVFTLSLKKDVIPRWAVYQELFAEELVEEANLSEMFQMKEDQFLEMFVNCYEEEVPSLLKLYKEKQE